MLKEEIKKNQLRKKSKTKDLESKEQGLNLI